MRRPFRFASEIRACIALAQGIAWAIVPSPPKTPTLPPKGKLSGGLLVVDDRLDVVRALERLLALYFDQVHTASTPSDAERVLRERAPAFLLCDYWLGEKYPPATALIPRWKREHPGLRRIALMSGTNSASIPPCEGVDQVFSKPLDTQRLVEFFTA